MRRKGLNALSFLFIIMLVSLSFMPLASAADTRETRTSDNYQDTGTLASSNTTENPDAAFVLPVVAVYALPAIGEVVLYVGGAIGVAGVIYYVGNWYNDYIQGLIQSSYQDAKNQGTPTNDHKTVTSSGDFGVSGDPDSSKDYVPAGVVKQRRYYNHNGNADMDIDYYDNNPPDTHVFPHRHDWVNGVRGNWYIP